MALEKRNISDGSGDRFHAFASAIFLLLVFVNLYYIRYEYNADWFAYIDIFQDGAWLAEFGKDSAFLETIEFFKLIVGLDYEGFRSALIIYFLICAIALVFFVKKKTLNNSSYLAVYLGVLPLIVPRFTVQIREAIADSFIFVGCYLLLNNNENKGRSWLLPAVFLAYLGSAFHSATSIFILILIFPKLWSLVKKIIDAPELKSLIYVLIPSAVALLIYLMVGGVNLEFIFSDFGEAKYVGHALTEVGTGGAKYIFWTFKSLLVVYLVVEFRSLSNKDKFLGQYYYSAHLSLLVIVPFLQILIIAMLLSAAPDIILSGVVRMYHLVLLMNFALLAPVLPKTKYYYIFCVFSLIDIYRVLFAHLDFLEV